MTTLNQLLGFLMRAIVTGLAIAFVIVYLWPAAMNGRGQDDGKNTETPAGPSSYAQAVDRAAPAVVSINTRSVLPVPGPQVSRSGSAFYLYQLRRFVNEGSGVIFSEDGYILTNYHVIRQAQQISIVLWDGRIIPAQLIGSDPATDLAVLKVELGGLPVAAINPEREVRVGDVVLAIGNSLGLSHTVSMGIVSAIGRNNLSSLLYQDFIQTDAAINVGNSGGALVNTRGELIGINARRIEATENAENIGFAIPVGLAADVMRQIIDYGEVRRGWLGASYSNLRPTQQPDGSLLQNGIGVKEVQHDGPAWNAGIRQGDIILSLNGEPVSDAARFLLSISLSPPGTRVELEVQRGNVVSQVYADLIQQPPL